MFDNFNWNSGWQFNPSFMWDWQDNPKERKKKLLAFIIASNLWLNLLYFLVYFLDWKSFIYKAFHDLSYLLTSFPSLSIFWIVQFIVAIIYFKQLKNNVIPKKKENIFSFINLINFNLLIILLDTAYNSYMWNTDSTFGFVWIFMLIVSLWLFLINVKNIFLEIKETAISLFSPKEEVEETDEEETELWRYDWISRYYEEETEPKAKLAYYRYAYWKIMTPLIQVINQTLLFEKNKLVAKEIIDNEDDDLFVQIDFPQISDEDEMEDFIDNLKFNNDYVKINDTFLALKIRTKFLRDPNHLIKVGEDILPNQIETLLKQIPFQPIKKLDPESIDYQKMINAMWKPYLLFSKVSIQQFWNDWYVVFNYSKYYRQMVIFPQMKTLPDLLDDKWVEIFSTKPNPNIFIWAKSTWWYVLLTLSKIKHLLFWWESGSWKSVFLRSFIYQLIYNTSPDSLKLVLIDPLKVSFQVFKKIKNLAYPVATSVEEANGAIDFLYKTSNERYTYLEKLWYEDIYSYNKDVSEKIINTVDEETMLPKKRRLEWNNSSKYEHLEILPKKEWDKYSLNEYKINKIIQQIVCVYDEFNTYNWELQYEKNWSLDTLTKIWEQARKSWIILVLWTQTINADSVPTQLRSNLKTRVSLTVSSKANSRAILWDAPSNKSDWALLTWNWDMLVYNWDELELNNAIRAQWFFVSEDDLIELISDNMEMFWKNDFIYKEKDEDLYNWIEDFYALDNYKEEKSNIITDEILERNNKEYDIRRIDLSKNLLTIIKHLNGFFRNQRTDLLDKLYLEDKNKNIICSTINYQKEEELKEIFNRTNYSNSIFEISDSFLKIKLDTNYLNWPDKLLKLEEKMDLQLNELKNSIFFEPIKPFDISNEEKLKKYNKMKELTDWNEYTLIDNFEIIKTKTWFYLQLNFTSWYKETVVFPNSKTARQILTEKYWNKIETMLKWENFIINK